MARLLQTIIQQTGNLNISYPKENPRGIPKSRKGKGILAWRSRQKHGAIMEPETFEKIKKEAEKRYGIGEERAKKIAGKAYWKTVKSKYRGKK